MVDFGEALRLFWSNYGNFRGRSTRAEYWWVQLALIGIVVVVGVVFGALGGTNLDGNLNAAGTFLVAVAGLVFLALIIPMLSLIVRRFHDRGLSGWVYVGLMVASLIPVLGIIATITSFVITVLPSQPETNKWGPNPSEDLADAFA